MVSLLSFVFVIFVIVLAHEFGHFIVAKSFGIRVNEFSIGFGPKIFSKKYGETEYVLRPIPIGGFVDLYGMEEDSVKDDWNRSFVSKTALQRFLTLGAGSFMNYVLAFVILFLVLFISGTPQPLFSEKPVIGFVLEESYANQNGIMLGDKVLNVNGNSIDSWQDFEKAMLNKNSDMKLQISRNDIIFDLVLPPKNFSNFMEMGIFQGKEPVVGEITPGQEAARVGIEVNDRIVKINDYNILIWEQASTQIHKSVNSEITISVERNDEIHEFTVIPRDILNEGFGIIGIAPKVVFGNPSSFTEAVGNAFYSVVRLTYTMIDMLKKLVTFQVSVKNLTGPVGIASVVGEKAREGISLLFYMMAFISINIGFLNLMPFPALDGGRLFFI
ncbi:MAG: RIP metalloprotease RseP, partial [Candidatus Muiribacteriota bacterium]